VYIETDAIKNDFFDDKYGQKGTQFKGSMPSYSFGFEVKDIPQGTISFAFILDDPDSVPVCGFTWTHWLGANLCQESVAENESIRAMTFVQGKNSWNENLYGGMAPPDKPHKYHFRVFALDCLLNVKNGFTLNDLRQAVAGHILDSADLWGMYSNK